MAGTRISGMASGIDTEQAIKDLTKSQTLRIDNVKRDRVKAQWTQELYRGVGDKIKSFTSGYFDVLKPSTNFKSSSAFAKFSYNVKTDNAVSTKVSIAATGDIKSFNHTIDSISQLATKDTWTGTESGIKGAKSSGLVLADLKTAIGTSDFKMNVSVDGVAKTITIANADVVAMTSVDDLKTALNSKISTAFGTDYANMVSKVSVAGKDELNFDMKANVVKVLSFTGSESTMTGLKMTSGASNFDYTTKKVSELFDLTGIDVSTLSFNGVTNFGINGNDTVSTMMDKINGSSANVKMYYNTTQDKFVLESTKEGSANDVKVDNAATTAFLGKLGVADNGNRVSGKNAKLKLDGIDIIQSSNTFTFEGVTYSLKGTYDGADGKINMSVTKDTQGITDNVVKFVNEYNKLLEELNGKLSEKTFRSFKPLSDDERKAMSDTEIKAWEERAKSGLAKSDPELQSMVNRMRSAIYETVTNAGITMSEIGITSSTDYKQKGQLVIDETKLKSAIENRYEDVVKLFSSSSDKDYMDANNVTERYQENGVANRLSDIFQDATRLFRDNSGKKGFLTEKAGVLGDTSQQTNTIQRSILEYDAKIDKLLTALNTKKENYYSMFAKMETAMSKMQNQSSWLASQLGGGK